MLLSQVILTVLGLQDPDNDGIQRAASAGGPPLPSVPTHVTGPPDAPSELALVVLIFLLFQPFSIFLGIFLLIEW